MTKYLIDSSAWIEYFLSSNKGFKVKEIIEEEKNEVFTHVLSIAEISSKLTRSGIDPTQSNSIINSLSETINIDDEVSFKAGKLHAEIRKEIKDFGLVDAFILLGAKENLMKIVTTDSHFKKNKETIMI
ncbi:MAG: PIN domain-containing protein [archaeon]|nr:PIN domain-containing protein [archaeon]